MDYLGVLIVGGFIGFVFGWAHGCVAGAKAAYEKIKRQ